MNFKIQDKGFSLLEIILSVGFMAGLAIFITQAMKTFNYHMNSSKAKQQMVTETTNLANLLASTAACTNTASHIAINADESLNQITEIIDEYGVVQYSLNEKFQAAEFAIDSMWISISEADVEATPSSVGTAYLKIKYKMNEKATKDREIVKKLKLRVKTDATNNITYCRLFSSDTNWFEGLPVAHPAFVLESGTAGYTEAVFPYFVSYPEAKYLWVEGQCRNVGTTTFTTLKLTVYTGPTNSFTMTLCKIKGMGAAPLVVIADELIPIPLPVYSATVSIDQGATLGGGEMSRIKMSLIK